MSTAILTLTTAAKDEVLATLFGSGCLVVLMRGGAEIADAGYTRQAVTFSSPTGKLQRTIENMADLVFGPWKDDARSPVTGWAVARDGVLITGALPFEDEREAPRRGDELVFRAGVMSLGL